MIKAPQWYSHHVRVFLEHTNVEGNVYWAHFYRWLGEAREAMVIEHCPAFQQLLAAGVTIVTCETSIKHHKSVYLGDRLTVRLHIGEVSQCSATLRAEYTHDTSHECVASGWQKIAFMDASQKIISVPPELLSLVEQFGQQTKGDRQ